MFGPGPDWNGGMITRCFGPDGWTIDNNGPRVYNPTFNKNLNVGSETKITHAWSAPRPLKQQEIQGAFDALGPIAIAVLLIGGALAIFATVLNFISHYWEAILMVCVLGLLVGTALIVMRAFAWERFRVLLTIIGFFAVINAVGFFGPLVLIIGYPLFALVWLVVYIDRATRGN